MALYLDIGVVRIQRYLGRWPSLAGRRNASALVSESLRPSTLESVIAGRALANDSAGEVDGVLSLVLPATEDPERLAADLLHELRIRLPAAEFEAAWAEGDDYLDAYPLMRRQLRDGKGKVALPTSHGFPPLKLCDLCGVDAAVARVGRPDGEASACPDCGLRAQQGGEPKAESTLHARTGWTLARNFDQLAKSGLDGAKENHLALVMADGNSFGAFFTALARSGRPRDEVSNEFKVATWYALGEATKHLGDSDGMARVLPHVVGGDDVLVSVPATYAWPFVSEYLRVFNLLIATAVNSLGNDLPVPTASASLVIAHKSWPFDRAATLADELLRLAKRAGEGVTSFVAWQEVTRRGADVADSLAPLGLEAIERWRPHVLELGESVSRSSRNRLESMIEQGASAAEIERVARRLGVKAPLSPNDVHDWDLRRALDLTRWFR